MTWPTITINTTYLDASSDDPSQARADIKQMADNVNDIKDSRSAVNGIAPLDSSSQVPTANLPTIAANKGGTGQTSFTIGDILVATSTTDLSKLAAGTSGYVFKSNGPGAAPTWQQEGGGLVAGTRLLFQQTTAPTGWTKETNGAFNNAALRIVTGSVSSGGTDDFTTVFGASKSTDGHALTVAQMPAHTHGQNAGVGGGGTNRGNSFATTFTNANGTTTSTITDSTGTGGVHSHTISLNLKYRDFIVAQKD